MAVLIIWLSDNGCVGSIQIGHHIHHNPAHLSQRKISCFFGSIRRLLPTFVFVKPRSGGEIDNRCNKNNIEKDVGARIELICCPPRQPTPFSPPNHSPLNTFLQESAEPFTYSA